MQDEEESHKFEIEVLHSNMPKGTKMSYGLGTEIALLFKGIGLENDILEIRTHNRRIANRKLSARKPHRKRAY